MLPLDNPAWSALTTCHAHLAIGGDAARRYPDQLTPIAAVATRDQRALDDLAGLVPPGDWISMPATLDDLVPLVRPPLSVKFTKTLVQMVCDHRVEVPPNGAGLCVLSEGDADDMMALVALTHPGPFRPRTWTLGTYVGIRVGGVLAAMGGQRMHLPGYREVSAICTHPEFRGRGYARTIIARLVSGIFDEGLTPFLHVQEENAGAQEVYRGLGFVPRARMPLIVVERAA